jgi:hypothetical protein
MDNIIALWFDMTLLQSYLNVLLNRKIENVRISNSDQFYAIKKLRLPIIVEAQTPGHTGSWTPEV